jgi:carboxyl-terminal processing protease
MQHPKSPAARGPLPSEKSRLRSSHAGAFVFGVVIATAVGAWAGPASSGAKGEKRFQKLDVFARVLSYVENNYVEQIDERKLIYGAAKGMVHTLDPHSAFMTPDEFADLQADTEGEFGGVGLQIDDGDNGVPVVVEVLSDTPAARAGLQPGDRIVKIDGAVTAGRDGGESTARLRGKPGTPVIVEIERKNPSGYDAPRAVSITREIIRVTAVDTMALAPGLAYVRIKQFQERTDQEVVAALEAHKKQYGKIDGLVLDLRGNPGGLLDQAVRVADLFIASGVIVTTRGRGNKKLEEETAHDGGTYGGFPIVCLINGQSASASEIVAGALQDHGRALLLGTRSYGKGSVQSVIPLEDGSGLKLTIARYYTPNGRSIQERGIDPDVEVEQMDPDRMAKARVEEQVEREEDLEGHLRNEQGQGAAGKKAPRTRALPTQPTAEASPPAAAPRMTPDNSPKNALARTGSIAEVLARDNQLKVAFQTLESHRKLKP